MFPLLTYMTKLKLDNELGERFVFWESVIGIACVIARPYA